MKLTYHTLDVFTRSRFGGNPLAVVLDADRLTDAEMQAVAREFNYSETTFVLRPQDARHTAHVRIFTPTVEVPFAGHPNVGTAYALALAEQTAEEFIFEEAAGLVRARILRIDGEVDTIQLTAPQPLTVGRNFTPASVAACLSLDEADIALGAHRPCIASVGLGFIVVEIARRDALRRAKADIAAFSAILPTEDADAIYLYCRELSEEDGAVDFSARMFAPFDGLPEDPATGSATAAACALIARLEGSAQRRFEVAQGIDMGRPSLLCVEIDAGTVRIGGACVPVMSGTISV
ncbi:PhzF family phenazine biosynthesis protein [Shinella sp. CPCC 101442]|uniref:PhzF family phenazine biosynthesis protein n=1 Tax=Shinella sp. CPCC 101442 TaxID=2932265 RepID=UPI0021523651|nr:PhzF family phenazine biosynthesis protein [Shinella sp. CPCC 101442]MCR6502288.1 PhzF family phenazine biosynthesis protein [Shinella sp. CPCC 101442]